MRGMTGILCSLLTCMSISANAEWTTFQDFSNHHWTTSFGGNTATMSGEALEGKAALKAAIDGGEPGYALLNTERFHPEDWSGVKRVEVSIHCGNEGHNSKLELKDAAGETIEAIFSDMLPAGKWIEVGFNLSPEKDYSEVGQVILSVENVKATGVTVHFAEMKLRRNGDAVLWDTMAGPGVDLFYSGDKARELEDLAEPINNRVVHSVPGALYLRWRDVVGNNVNFHEATLRLDQPLDVSGWSGLRMRVKTRDQQVAFKPFLWDGDTGFSPAAKPVSTVDQWEWLTFDLKYKDQADFDPKQVTEFKIVVENIDYGGGGRSGEAFVDDVETEGLAPAGTSGSKTKVEGIR